MTKNYEPRPISTPTELARYIEQTDAGMTLSKISRFDYFRGSLSPESWESLLGPDVNDLRHLGFTASLAEQLVRDERTHPCGNKLSLKEKLMLKVTALTHDLGEATTGDTPANIKDGSDELIEKVALTREVGQLATRCTRLMSDTLSSVPDIAFGSGVANNPFADLAEIFAGIESIGYTTTALRAWRIHRLLENRQSNGQHKHLAHVNGALEEIDQGELSEQLRRLATEVIGSRYFTRLIEFSSSLPTIADFLLSRRKAIDQIYNSDPSFDWYSKDERLAGRAGLSVSGESARRGGLFDDALTEWHNFTRRPRL